MTYRERKMHRIEDVVFDELKDKNAGLDTIQRFVRVSIRLCGVAFTEDEAIEIVKVLVDRLPFNPLEDVF